MSGGPLDASPGYICKTCGGPSPMGVGYTSTEPGARDASMPLTACGCGASHRPDSVPVGFFLVDPGGRLLVWTDNERHAASLRSDYGEGYRVRPAMVQAVADGLLARYVAGGGKPLEGRRVLVELVYLASHAEQIADGLESHGFAAPDESLVLALALVQPVGVEVAGAVVTADERVLSVRWPIWLADDERERLTAELRAFLATAVEAVRR